MTTYSAALTNSPNLQKYGHNAILLFALQLRFRIDDIDTVAAEALTDGHNDKKCDLVYVDPDEGVAVIAQGYMSQDESKTEAPANKASDLNTAVAWLLSRPINDLPERLRPAADRLRDSLRSSQIRAVHIWYVHNLPGSANVKGELHTAELTAQNALRQSAFSEVEVSATEVSLEILEEWYTTAQTPILVTGEFKVAVPGGYEIAENDWSAYVTAVPARWLYNLYAQHGIALFSANVRGYLGSRNSDRNINNGIKQTAQDDPTHFWTFNNGITALVHQFQPPQARQRRKALIIQGISVVNGAQTTGAIGSLRTPPSDEAMVPARFVRCSAPDTIRNIIRYNNSQNKVTAPDFRSNDPIQQRLRHEFQGIPGADYTGGRRGLEEDLIKRPTNVIPSETAAQVLAAFHQDPALGYNEKSEIWESNAIYSRYFHERTSATHIIFCYSLLRSIDTKKRELVTKSASGEGLTAVENSQLSYLRKRGANFLLVAAIARCLETFLGRQVPDPFRASFGARVGFEDAERRWRPMVESALAFYAHLGPAIDLSLKRNERIPSAIDTFRSLMEATRQANEGLFKTFAGQVQTS